MPGARCPDAERHWLRTAIAVHDESRRSQIRAKCSCPPTKQSSLLLQGVRCQRSQDILEFPSTWGHSASSLPCLSRPQRDLFSIQVDGTGGLTKLRDD